MNINKKVTVKCPNCEMIAVDNAEVKEKTLFCTCKFCDTRFKWMRTKSEIIIPADKKHYLTLNILGS
jgi:uncharacterized Zn-finger protein